ncbi:hypothetical protein [Psychrobacillus sp. FSL K6-1464]|uniref:hypothetical protein n=1 Tax=Psychrobacillus sp. FSL K6-1464 TaxID=2921545 RepID=UPI0030FC59E2
MKRKLFLTVLMAVFLLLVPTIGFAQSNEGAPLETLTKDTSYEDVVSPMVIPCDYWSNGNHQMQSGQTYTDEVYSSTHSHVISGVTFTNCKIYNKYTVSERYCACGYKTQNRVSAGTAHYYY